MPQSAESPISHMISDSNQSNLFNDDSTVPETEDIDIDWDKLKILSPSISSSQKAGAIEPWDASFSLENSEETSMVNLRQQQLTIQMFLKVSDFLQSYILHSTFLYYCGLHSEKKLHNSYKLGK